MRFLHNPMFQLLFRLVNPLSLSRIDLTLLLGVPHSNECLGSDVEDALLFLRPSR